MSNPIMGCCPLRNNSTNNNRVRTAGLVIIGDEILKGQVADTNSHFMCKMLYSYGIKVARISVIGDGIDEIAKEVKKFSSAFDYVLTTGGIGPTHDDMTYVGVAKAFDEPIALHEDMNCMVDKWLANKGYDPEVLRKMAELPKTAELLFDRDRPSTSFPIVIVKNVYVFPGVPQFLEKMVPRMAHVFRSDSSAMFHCREIYVAKDEMSITPQINLAVAKFKDHVTFGSYPVIGNLYFSTRLTMESLSTEHVQAAQDYLAGLMPENSVVSYDKGYVANATSKVYDIVNDSSHELHSVVQKAVKIVAEALEKYKLEDVCICFNGGKDCTALLHLVHAVVQKNRPDAKVKLQSLYIKGENSFIEMETFIEETWERYNLNPWTYNGPIKNGLRAAVDEHSGLKGVFMGTRRADPCGETLGYFEMTDAGWPAIMRISPMLDWSFSEIWSFLRSLSLPYCPLYDRGYTSIGNRSNTVPNPALAVETNDGKQKYRPAYTLVDVNAERTGRQ